MHAEPLYSPAASDDETAIVAEYFKLKGSTFHAYFQDALKHCRRLTPDEKEIPMQLLIESVNARDENAIVVQVKLDNTWQPLSCILASKVEKSFSATKPQFCFWQKQST